MIAAGSNRMKIKFIEATNTKAGGFNWGKFMVARFEPEEWAYRSAIQDEESFAGRPEALLSGRGWTPDHILVMDLQTGEGAIFRPSGLAPSDLHKHQIWVCPMYEPFLAWLYKQNLSDLDALPACVDIDDPRSSMHGYRRPGPK